ncbi:MAG: hypothetical protein PSN44_01970 [Gammaproteobacteria bacterium]|nr:hypothetical protein [Gammaproteobacteria bacterium]
MISHYFSFIKIVTLIPTFSLKGEGAKALNFLKGKAKRAKALTPSPVGEGWGEEIKLRINGNEEFGESAFPMIIGIYLNDLKMQMLLSPSLPVRNMLG